MTIIRYGGYLSKHIVNTMSEIWATTMLDSKLLKIYVSYDKGAKSLDMIGKWEHDIY